MQYALLNRFQGTLLGATLGEMLGLQAQAIAHSQAPISRLSTPISALTGHYAQLLTEQGRVSEGDERTQALWQQSELAPQTITTSAATIVLLPIALFFHEADWQLLPQLQVAVAPWQNPHLDHSGLALMARAIAALLREQPAPSRLIPSLLQGLDLTSHWHQPLQTVQTHLEQKAGLVAMRQSLAGSARSISEETAIALALYCFLSTPDAFDLSLGRAVQLGLPSAIVPALVGALSGAHNSLSGIPIAWRLAMDQAEPGDGQPITSSTVLALADRLLTTWSGAYLPEEYGATALTAAIAAPQVIRHVPSRGTSKQR